MDLSNYNELFAQEAEEILNSLADKLLILEKTPSSDTVQEVFRASHTLKGMAATMGFTDIVTLTHEMENLLDKVRKKEMNVSKEMIDALLKGVDLLTALVENVKEGKNLKIDISGVITNLKNIADKTSKSPLKDLTQISAPPSKKETTTSMRVELKLLDELLNLVVELEVNKTKLYGISKLLNNDELSNALYKTEKLIRQLQDKIFKARLVTINSVFSRFSRLVRDLSRQTSKEVDFKIIGGELGIDKVIADYLIEPLTHIITNAVTHGIESPETRISRNKPKTGSISLIATREKGFVMIEIKDDGNGIDPQTIRKKAVETGIISYEESRKLNDNEVIMLITSPKFSTASSVTKSAGRGVGMDIVKTSVDKMHGSLLVNSKIKKGSSFIIKLPLTLAVMQALLVEINNQTFCLPFLLVKELSTKKPDNGHIMFGNEHIEVVNLASLLNIPYKTTNNNVEKNMVIIEVSNKKKALVVDKFIHQQQIVVKPLPSMLKIARPNYIGGTILENGKVALILDLNTII